MLLENPYIDQQLDFNFLKGVHKELFKSIYDWAGELRTVDISSGETRFCHATHIQDYGDNIFLQLSHEKYLHDLSIDMFVDRVAHFYSEINVLHPFREGNGRALRAFLSVLALKEGLHIAWDKMSPEENIVASIAGYQGDETPLRKMFYKIIEQGS